MTSKVSYFEMKELSEILLKPSDEKVVLCDGLTAVQVLTICSNQQAEHIVQKSNVMTDAELKLSSFSIDSPEKFIEFPLSVIMGVEEPTAHTEKERLGFSFELSEPAEINDVLVEIENYLSKFCKRKSITDDIRLAADELISNCLFNAPYVNIENSNSNIERRLECISIDPRRKPKIFVGYDSNRVIIGCTDMYGSLNVNKLIERIRDCYVKNPGNMINFDKSGGAGIGSYLVFEHCMSYYVAVKPGIATTVCCAFPVNMSAKERNNIPKNVHIVSKKF